MDVPALLKDKKTLYVIAGGAVLGAIVLLRGGGGLSGASAADNASAAGSGATPTFQDGGSDIAATLGNFSTELQGILQNYQDGLTDGVTPPPVVKPPTTVPKPTPKPPITGKPVKPGKPVVRKPATKSILIRRGDTLSGLAKKNHTTTAALAKLNGIKNVNLIYAGHHLKVPVAKKK